MKTRSFWIVSTAILLIASSASLGIARALEIRKKDLVSDLEALWNPAR